jgi:hypothetical protein
MDDFVHARFGDLTTDIVRCGFFSSPRKPREPLVCDIQKIRLGGSLMFWLWLLKYSSLLVTGVISFGVSYCVWWLTNRRSYLIYYTSHPQWVTMPAQQGQQAPPPIGTFTLFLWNPGKAPAKEVHVGHFWLPANNVYPDLPRNIVPTPSG